MKQQYKITFWMLPVEPQQGLNGQKRIYLNLYTSELKQNDDYYANEVIDDYARRIMDANDWFLNLDWSPTNIAECEGMPEGFFELTDSPSAIKKKAVAVIRDKQLAEFQENLAELSVTKKDIEFDEKTANIIIKNKLAGDIKLSVNDFYSLIETKTPDAELTNSFGNKVLKIMNGSFLNAGLADIKVFSNTKDMAEDSFFNPMEKGGIFIREDGRLHFGDIARTKFMEVNLSSLAQEWYKHKFLGKETKSIDLVKQITE